jgi:hypothetical protein
MSWWGSFEVKYIILNTFESVHLNPFDFLASPLEDNGNDLCRCKFERRRCSTSWRIQLWVLQHLAIRFYLWRQPGSVMSDMSKTRHNISHSIVAISMGNIGKHDANHGRWWPQWVSGFPQKIPVVRRWAKHWAVCHQCLETQSCSEAAIKAAHIMLCQVSTLGPGTLPLCFKLYYNVFWGIKSKSCWQYPLLQSQH